MNKKLLTFAITVCNEIDEFTKLLTELVHAYDKNLCDILVVKDVANITYDNELKISSLLNVDFCTDFYDGHLKITNSAFTGNFSEFKNKIEPACNSSYIFQIDADETIPEYLIKTLPTILQSNPDPDILYVPRINTVHNIEKSNILEWNWNISSIEALPKKKINSGSPETKEYLNLLKEFGYWNENEEFYTVPVINFPDYQGRIFKTGMGIKWENKVHEILGKNGNYNIQLIPHDDLDYCILHQKDITRQISQNKKYNEL
jgi:hypothetical protein